MTHYVKVVFASDNGTSIKLRQLDRLSVEARLDQNFSQWIDNAGSAPDPALSIHWEKF